VVRAYGPRLTRLAYGIVRDREQAEDIVQDVLWRVWDGRPAWRALTSLRAYLIKAVRNRALNAVRDRHTREQYAHAVLRSSAADPDLALTPNPADALADAEASAESMAALRRGFLRLTERQQTAVRLRYEEGLTYPELAAALGVTRSGAEQLVARAIHTLRAVLAKPPRE
jgi:RNA polymerase sigma-70 factor, ECF subfamily